MLKSLPSQLFTLTKRRTNRRNLRSLFRFLLVLAAMILVYSAVFHFLMLREGQEFSWITGLYWTLTVMSTLGFGDITFHTDLGRAFSILVLLSGMVFLLVLLPFTLIEFFYEPWVRAQAAARTPKGVDADTQGHVVITNHDHVTAALIRRIDSFRGKYVVLVEDADEALRLQDHGVRVAVGALDDPESYRRVRADQAAMVVATGSDITNTNVAFTVREVAPKVRIAASVHSDASVDVLQLAGCDHVLKPEEIVGQWFARRVPGAGRASHVIGRVDSLLIAESSAQGTPLVGQTLVQTDLRRALGVSVAGVYRRGQFEAAAPDTAIDEDTVLVLVSSKEGLARYDETYDVFHESTRQVLILGGGRVGRATARAVARGGHDYRIVEKEPSRIRNRERYVEGDAAELEILEAAGLKESGSIIITTHDDDLNVYLTLYCRKLRPDAQIIARATDEPHVATLHRAGADFVMSYATTGANTLFNLLRQNQILMVTEGLDCFRAKVPSALAGRTIAESGIRDKTSCTVVGLTLGGDMKPIPGPEEILAADTEMLLLGTVEARERFLAKFPAAV